MATSYIVPAALAALPLASAAAYNPLLHGRATCSSSVESCSSGASSADTCCVNRPGGQFLQTQFWDTDPVTGPDDSWTIHGLWPDNCDGTYDENCDTSREYNDITSILQNAGKSDLLDYMNDYWQSNSESPEEFWEHEWGTHGTCVSTLDPSCYSDYTEGQEAADFFQLTVDLFKTLDTYGALMDAGIAPSSSDTYTSSDILDALTAVTGSPPTISCDGDELSQVFYGFFVNGPIVNADFVASEIVGGSNDCPDSGVKYLPKSGGSSPPTSSSTSTPTQTSSTSTPTGTGTVSGSGNWNAEYNGKQDGCLISAGTWYTTGTCATYTATPSGAGFTLKSSKGSCGVSGGKLTCGSGVSATVFTTVGGYLAYEGSADFYVDSAPSGSTQATVYTSSKSVTVKFQWKSV